MAERKFKESSALSPSALLNYVNIEVAEPPLVKLLKERHKQLSIMSDSLIEFTKGNGRVFGSNE